MRRLWPLVVALIAAALLTGWMLRPGAEDRSRTLDGLWLGMSRDEVEARLGPPRARVAQVDDANFTAFVILHEDADGRSMTVRASGNHPPGEGTGESLLRDAGRLGHAYGPESGMPYVGYDALGRVVWIYGTSLVVGGRSYALADLAPGRGDGPLGPGEPRPDHCMAGPCPCAVEYQGGSVEVLLARHTMAGPQAVRLGR